jgi:cytochrome c553
LSLVFAATFLLGGASISSAGQGDVEQGRTVFNGKGICYFCHGRDGRIDQLPELSPETAGIIARLDPKPSDLRSPRTLKAKSDQERFRTIREGHSGTAMLPDKQLNDKEIIDLLAYLSALRGEPPE